MFDESKKFNEYSELVLEKLDEKLASTEKGANWEFITPASLKAEALCALEERFDTKDEPLLRVFFKHKENATAYWNTIKNEDTTKFKPLVNYLRNRSVDTKKRNIELLAWLIDFQPRPFNATKDYASLKKEPGKAKSEAGKQTSSQTGPVTVKRIWISGNHRKLFAVLVMLFILTIAGYYIVRPRPNTSTGVVGCMIWTGEEYKQIACNYKPETGGISAIPLDTAVFRHFKKIKKDDTLTANSIGKVFCVKVDGKYEYYTDSAAHPVYPEKRLRRLTQYIMNNNP